MPLRDDLLDSARRLAAAALEEYSRHEPNYDFVLRHLADAVEQIAKAYLCSISGALLADQRFDVEHMLILLGHDDKTMKSWRDVKTIGATEAVNRVEKILKKKVPASKLLEPLREIRNGITHLGLRAEPSEVRVKLAPGIRYINALLDELDESRDVFWGGDRHLSDALIAQAVNELRLRFEHKLRQARSQFANRFSRMADSERTRVVAALAAGPLFYGLVEGIQCPACKSPAWVAGRESKFSPDGEDFELNWFDPQDLGCRVCGLMLEGEELGLANVTGHVLDPYGDTSGYWLPNPPS